MKKKIVALLMAVAMCMQFSVQLAASALPPDPAPDHEHVFNQEVVKKEYLRSPAACKRFATYFKSCVCGATDPNYYFTPPNPAYDPNNHWELAVVLQNAKDATCTEPGYSGDKFCNDCQKTVEQGHATPALGHEASPKEWMGVEAVHFNPCVRYAQCQIQLNAENHNYDEQVVDTPATETAPGYSYMKCSKCGMRGGRYEIPQRPHQHEVTLHQGRPATCTEVGEQSYYTCSHPACANKKYSDESCQTELTDPTLPINPDNHDFSDAWVYDKDGTTHWHLCTRCAAKKDEANHSFSPYIPDGNATTQSGGTETATCQTCGATKQREGSKINLANTVTEVLTVPPAADGGLEFFAKKKENQSVQGLPAGTVHVVDITAKENGKQIDKTNLEYEFKMKIPQNLLKSGRVFTVYRQHGQTNFEALPTTQNGDLLTFKSNKFSLFALTYRDTTSSSYWDDDDYEEPEYDLSFNTNGGKKLRTITKTSGSRVNLNKYAPTKEGYTFVGWYSDRALTKEISSITLYRDRTVYAKWARNAASAKPNPNTGAGPLLALTGR